MALVLRGEEYNPDRFLVASANAGKEDDEVEDDDIEDDEVEDDEVEDDDIENDEVEDDEVEDDEVEDDEVEDDEVVDYELEEEEMTSEEDELTSEEEEMTSEDGEDDEDYVDNYTHREEEDVPRSRLLSLRPAHLSTGGLQTAALRIKSSDDALQEDRNRRLAVNHAMQQAYAAQQPNDVDCKPPMHGGPRHTHSRKEKRHPLLLQPYDIGGRGGGHQLPHGSRLSEKPGVEPVGSRSSLVEYAGIYDDGYDKYHAFRRKIPPRNTDRRMLDSRSTFHRLMHPDNGKGRAPGPGEVMEKAIPPSDLPNYREAIEKHRQRFFHDTQIKKNMNGVMPKGTNKTNFQRPAGYHGYQQWVRHVPYMPYRGQAVNIPGPAPKVDNPNVVYEGQYRDFEFVPTGSDPLLMPGAGASRVPTTVGLASSRVDVARIKEDRSNPGRQGTRQGIGFSGTAVDPDHAQRNQSNPLVHARQGQLQAATEFAPADARLAQRVNRSELRDVKDRSQRPTNQAGTGAWTIAGPQTMEQHAPHKTRYTAGAEDKPTALAMPGWSIAGAEHVEKRTNAVRFVKPQNNRLVMPTQETVPGELLTQHRPDAVRYVDAPSAVPDMQRAQTGWSVAGAQTVEKHRPHAVSYVQPRTDEGTVASGSWKTADPAVPAPHNPTAVRFTGGKKSAWKTFEGVPSSTGAIPSTAAGETHIRDLPAATLRIDAGKMSEAASSGVHLTTQVRETTTDVEARASLPSRLDLATSDATTMDGSLYKQTGSFAAPGSSMQPAPVVPAQALNNAAVDQRADKAEPIESRTQLRTAGSFQNWNMGKQMSVQAASNSLLGEEPLLVTSRPQTPRVPAHSGSWRNVNIDRGRGRDNA